MDGNGLSILSSRSQIGRDCAKVLPILRNLTVHDWEADEFNTEVPAGAGLVLEPKLLVLGMRQ